jgi:hypothetical protein
MSRVTDLFQPDDIRSGRVRPPSHLANVALTRSPANDFKHLVENYPEIIPYIVEGEDIPSDVVEVVIARMEGADRKDPSTQTVSSDG